MEVPALTNPSKIESGYDHACALDDYGLRCWGNNALDQSAVPSLVDVSEVGAGTHHTCAIEAFGVNCWGYNSYNQIDVPADLLFGTVVESDTEATTYTIAVSETTTVITASASISTVSEPVNTVQINNNFAINFDNFLATLRAKFGLRG